MVKKVIVIMLTFLLSINIIPIRSEAKSSRNIEGVVNMNLSNDGGKMLDNVQKAELDLNNIKIDKSNEIRLQGNIICTGEQVEFNLAGQLGLSAFNNKNVVGELKDNNNNFEVIDFAIEKEVPENRMFVKKEKLDSDLIKLYMMRMNTREFYMFEFSTNEINSSIKLRSDELKVLENSELNEQWWLKVFTPVQVKTPSLMALSSSTSNKTLSYRVEMAGPTHYYQYTMKIKAMVEASDLTSSQNVTDNSYLQVLQEYSTNETGAYLSSTDSYLQIKNCKATGQLYNPNSTLYTNNFYDVITQMNWGTVDTEKQGGLTISPGLWIGKWIYGIGVSFTLFTTSVDVSGLQTFNSSENVRAVSLTYPKALTAVNDKYSLSIMKARTASFGAPKQSVFSYSFDVYYFGQNKAGSDYISASTYYN